MKQENNLWLEVHGGKTVQYAKKDSTAEMELYVCVPRVTNALGGRIGARRARQDDTRVIQGPGIVRNAATLEHTARDMPPSPLKI